MKIGIETKICDAFDKSQHGHQNQAKLAEDLKKFYNKCNESRKLEFRDEFLHRLKLALVIFNREPAVERVMEFSARFASLFAQISDEEDNENEDVEDPDNFYNFLFKFLIENHSAQSKAVRFRVCQLVKLLLHVVPRDAALDEDLAESITASMLVRVMDIIPGVRAQAVRALTRLQQPTEPDCPVIDRYIFLMKCDESAEVRSAVLSCITLTTRTLPELIKRVRDGKESVRKQAFQILAQRVGVRALTCSRRLYILEQGLLDKSEAVQNLVKNQLLQSWSRAHEGDILGVIGRLDPVGALKITRMAVHALFDAEKVEDLVNGFHVLNENHIVELASLTPESALMWCELCEHVRKKGVDHEQFLERLLPSLTDFCQYLEIYFDKFLARVDDDSQEAQDEAEEKEFIGEQLLKIASGFDLSDDAGRRSLTETVRKLTSKVDVTHFLCIVSALARMLKVLYGPDQEDARVQMAAEMIQEAREITDVASSQTTIQLSEDEMRSKQIQLAKIRVKIIEISEDLEEQVRSKRFSEAAQTQKTLDELNMEKNEIEESMEPKLGPDEDTRSELRSDPATILKCLQIAKEVCSASLFFGTGTGVKGKPRRQKRTLHPTFLELVDTLFLPSIASRLPEIREVAVECLGKCCLYSVNLSIQHLPLFLQITIADIVEVRIKALGCIVDILRIFGMEAFAPRDEDEKKEEREDLEEDVSEIPDSEDLENQENEEDSKTFVTTRILTKIVEMLDEENADIRHAAATGLAMILVSGRIVSPAIFSRLLLLWYNPNNQDEHSTVNQISCFLDLYPYMCRATHDCIQEAFLPTLRTLFDAPNSSPLSSVDINNVAELLVYLTKPSVIKSLPAEDSDTKGWKQRIDWLGESSAHDHLAVKISNEILQDPRSLNVGILARTLSMLELSSSLQENLKDLTILCEEMREKVKDKTALRYLLKFQTNVRSLVLVRPEHTGDVTMVADVQNEEVGSEEFSQESEISTILPSDNTVNESETTIHIARKRQARLTRSSRTIAPTI